MMNENITEFINQNNDQEIVDLIKFMKREKLLTTKVINGVETVTTITKTAKTVLGAVSDIPIKAAWESKVVNKLMEEDNSQYVENLINHLKKSRLLATKLINGVETITAISKAGMRLIEAITGTKIRINGDEIENPSTALKFVIEFTVDPAMINQRDVVKSIVDQAIQSIEELTKMPFRIYDDDSIKCPECEGNLNGFVLQNPDSGDYITNTGWQCNDCSKCFILSGLAFDGYKQ